MGKIGIPYGGGPDLDPVTATAADVRKDKVIVDKNGNPLTGTMAEKGAATYTPGRANQVIAANQYLAGAQTIKGDANLLAQYIKKNVTIFGVTGTFEGYVPTSTDLYLRGNNPAGWAGTSWTFDTGQITLNRDYYNPYLTCSKAYNLTGFTKCNIQCNLNYKCYEANTFRLSIVFQRINGTTFNTFGTYYSNSTSTTYRGEIITYNSSYAIPFNQSITTTYRLFIIEQMYYSATGWSGTNESRGEFTTGSAIYRIWIS